MGNLAVNDRPDYTTPISKMKPISIYPNPLLDTKERFNMWKDSGFYWNGMSGGTHYKSEENDINDIYWKSQQKSNIDPNSPKDNYTLHS